MNQSGLFSFIFGGGGGSGGGGGGGGGNSSVNLTRSSSASLSNSPRIGTGVAKPVEAIVDSKLFQFDPDFSVVYRKLHTHSCELLKSMGDDVSGDQVLLDLDDPGVGGDFKSKGQLAPFLSNVHYSLGACTARLGQLFAKSPEELEVLKVNDFASVLFFVVEAGSQYDQTGSALILDALFATSLLQPAIGGGTSSSATTSSVKFALLLRAMMSRLTHRLSLSATARALGRFAKMTDASSRGDFVKFEISRAMEWLSLASHAKRRLPAVLILSALMDADKHTRFAARDAIHTFFLATIKSKEDREYFFKKCYSMIISPTHGDFGENLETIHGSLLVVGELVNAPSNFIRPSLTKICAIVFDLKDHANPLVVRALLYIIPGLVSSYKDDIPDRYKVDSLDFVCAKALVINDFETNKAALRALQVLVEEKCMKVVILANLNKITEVLTRGFATIELAPLTLMCFGKFAQAGFGGNLISGGLNLLDDAFLFGLEHACTELLFALCAFADNFSDSKPLIRARLIHEISLCLCGKPFEVLDPSSLLLAVSEDDTESNSQDDLYFFISILRQNAVEPLKTMVPANPDKQELQREALKALATFDFGRLNLLSFLETELIPLILAPNREVQMEALTACFHVLKKDIYWESQVPVSIKYSPSKWEIVKACLTTSACDRDPDVRLFASEILWKHATLLQMFLCTELSLNLLFSLANDLKLFKVRIVAIKLLSFLSESNPSMILPFLRKFVIAQMDMLRNAVSKREELESCLLLDTMIRSLMFRYHALASDLLQPFLELIVKDLLAKLRQMLSTNGLITTHLIQLLGAISQANTPSLNPLLQEAIPILISCAFDSTAIHGQREAALSTLTELLKKTDSIVAPSYSELIEPLLTIISGSTNSAYSWAMQTEALRTLGTLGALDPAVVRSTAARATTDEQPTTFDGTNAEVVVGENGWNIIAVGKAKRPSPSASSTRNNSYNNHLSLIPDDAGGSGNGNEFRYGEQGGYDNEELEADGQRNLVADQFADDSSEDDKSDSEYGGEMETLLPVRGSITEFGTATQEHLDFHFRIVAIEALTRIMNSNSFSAFHLQVIDAAGNMCRSLKCDVVTYLPKLVPAMIRCLASSSSSWHLKRSTIRQLTVFVSELKKHMRPYVRQMLFYVKQNWDHVLLEALMLLEEIALAFREEFNAFPGVSWIVPRVVAALGRAVDDDSSVWEDIGNGGVEDKDWMLRKSIRTCVSMKLCIAETEYAHRVSALLVALLDSHRRTSSKVLVLDALNSIGSESLVLDSVSLFQCLPSMFDGEEYALVEPSLRLASTLLLSNRRSGNHSFAEAFYSMLTPNQMAILSQAGDHVAPTEGGGALPRHDSTEAGGDDDFADAEDDQDDERDSIVDVPNMMHSIRLREVADVSQVNSEDDWNEWLRRFSVELLRESPEPTLRACATVAQAHNPLARDLFNAAFVSCYTRLGSEDRPVILHTLRHVFKHPRTPPDVMQVLLNLCEFMEQNQLRLPIDNLPEYAIKCHAYAKALHYKEMEFRHTRNSVSITADDLIAINHRLERHEAAQGLLKISSQNGDLLQASFGGSRYSLHKRASNVIVLHGRETWHEQLGRFRDALESYESKLAQLSEDDAMGKFDLVVGKMRCLLALGEYDKITALGKQNWRRFDQPKRRVLAPLIAHAIWESGESWKKTEPFMQEVNGKILDGAVLNVVAKIQTGNWLGAREWIDKARRILATDVTTSVSESYTRVYHQVVVAQQLCELEEVALLSEKYRKTTGPHFKRNDFEQIRQVWDKRLTVCQKSVRVYQQLLAVRRLVIPPEDDIKTSIKFVSICRREERWGLARSILKRLGVVSDYSVLESLKKNCNKRAIFSALKLSWVGAQDEPPAGNQESAYRALNVFVDHLNLNEEPDLVSKCRLTLAEWTMALHGEAAGREAMEHVNVALNIETGNKYKAAHAWASLNFLQFETEGDGNHLVTAIQGFFSAIALGKQQGGSAAIVIQDVLRLLTLWFHKDLRAYPKAVAAVRSGFSAKCIPLGTWLSVIPQLIARIQSNPIGLRDLLVGLGQTYPQALVYPLTVAARSSDERVSLAAEGILNKLRATQSTLLDQANLVAKEMTRIAILLPEEWYDALEEAANCWYTPANSRTDDSPESIRGRLRAFRKMQLCLRDLNSRLLSPNLEDLTMHERHFLNAFGSNLERAAKLMMLYEERQEYKLPNGQKSSHARDAWIIYRQTFQDLGSKYLPTLSQLNLEDISPKLLSMKELELCVPGVLRANEAEDQIKIRSFGHRVKVFKTKQRPRRIALLGNQGLTYRYLLKGREDLRQDERAMQLFSLVNVLLSKTKRKLSIHSYVVIPLSEDVGLIGWLPQTDTLHSLIRGYRAEKDIPLNLEQIREAEVSPFHMQGVHTNEQINEANGGNSEGYDRLTLMQKVEAFEHSLQSTDGDDLANIMWFKSKSAEVWLERRTNYVRSLATMSMVGYILGLGDRHPSNIMLHRTSGKIVHIDFGDCFEVAMHREKYPELVPFRLTRMLVSAMDVCGVEGDFRCSCEAVMDVLRENRDSVMAMLEAFVHDPLMSWKLIAEEEMGDAQQQQQQAARMGENTDTEDDGTEGESDGEVRGMLEEDLMAFYAPGPTPSVDPHQQQEEHPMSLRGIPIPRPTSANATAAANATIVLGRSVAEAGLSQSFRGPRAMSSIRLRKKSSMRRISEEDDHLPVEELLLNRQAVMVVRRVKDKLTGNDFDTREHISTTVQVERLIQQATSNANLAASFIGWCPGW
ncbi:hypothetical protein BASA81_008390 [Batrachochytrium salamandrivorans]|nr:hypothetical protein BASA81_008390 [Batrachochytrium salamandrivorans]